MNELENLKKLKKDMDNLSGVEYRWENAYCLGCWIDHICVEDFMLLLQEYCDTSYVDGRIFGDYVYIVLNRELPFNPYKIAQVFEYEETND